MNFNRIDDFGEVWIEMNIDHAPAALKTQLANSNMLRTTAVPHPTLPSVAVAIVEMNLTAYISMQIKKGDA